MPVAEGWKANYDGLKVSEAKRLRELEEESRQLVRLVAELSRPLDEPRELETNMSLGRAFRQRPRSRRSTSIPVLPRLTDKNILITGGPDGWRGDWSAVSPRGERKTIDTERGTLV